ncbi:hypothetical protein RHMOL_Rhmol04G0015300 [Rhododendron molle]|uniref:Uncharacterized protein n=1 Tax=Rhododendron molle TaxID=49168 RepID=A0ACC0NYB8_RHOML|nr:hypothetical protein RHMOL_Rhmol04G0015300 [Rhododendron molle]
MNVGDLNKVWEIKALKKVGEDEARKILDRIAKQVQPIMRKHKWRVKLLSEFCPTNPSLLGLNVGGGVHVKLRLRRPNRDWDFFPFDQVLDTMLHELCHNAHGPHNANFYKLWDELRKECEDLMSKGITGTGEGFDLPGVRLGGLKRQPPLSSLRKTALAAAEKRAQLGSLLPSGPKRLGGDSSIMTALSPIQAAAMAAERRLQDDIWCGSQSCEESGEGESSSDITEKSVRMGISAGNSRLPSSFDTRASDAIPRKRSQDSNNGCPEYTVVDLTTDSSVPSSMVKRDSVPQKRSRETRDKSFLESSNDHPKSTLVDLSLDASTSGSVFNNDETHNIEEFATWECVTCTLLNPICCLPCAHFDSSHLYNGGLLQPLAPICELCGTQKPKDVETKYKFWSCKFCTLENSVKVEKCTACGQWRFSHGAPSATSAPYLGT